MFTLLKESGAARRGVLTTRHGEIQTPIFMPVGTQATVKGLTPQQIEEAGAQIILGNTYHLNIRPGSELIRDLGGLHRFMNWNGPILTDSGGFQVFSLAKLRKITEKGIEFRSHLDGQKLFLDPRECYRIQANLDTDIAMVLDECPPFPCERDDCEQAVKRTIRWAGEFLEHAREDGFLESGHHVFAIIQGSTYDDLRRHCGQALAEMDFPGYAVGGVSVGEPEEEMLKQVAACAPVMPRDKPRYVMGVGTPPQLLKMVGLGMDMFDCVMPTRLARHATVFTPEGPLNLKNECFKHDAAPIMEADNYTCQNFSRAYLRHLIMSKELLAHTLLSIHNVHFFLDLMAQARAHIEAGDFESWSHAWIERYQAGG
ncbi:tRNA guanosine(34) transglycosylase Tgt [Coraliomargarita sinensis]|uniref:Queuine tRNA-ribosyltransferase n=1 Tax=Coraliomargarita sinensis TaxID=2174842 RepID=A0A317ZPC8_9BACT|nr:tRNA guanosine(34) transglycosylase Tgt [Coraliomargarita sinensis]PXA05221.1 tRNA guanosine(34) transglycosylase Tgt [Coraliomargarita sinensis]